MHRIDTNNAENNRFVDGNPNAGKKGTIVDASWLNSVQEEIAGIVVAAGMTLDKESDSQLLAALKKIFENYFKTTNASFSMSESSSSTKDSFSLCPNVINVPKNKVLDLTLSFRAVSYHDDYIVWFGKNESPDVKILRKDLIIKDHDGNTRSSVRLILPAADSDRNIKVFGTWHDGDDGNFFDIEGSYRIGY